jgi:hypothetical protein
MGLFSIFKTPVNEIIGIICAAYYKKLRATGDSQAAFIDMAEEAFAQLRKQGKSNFSSATETYRMLSSTKFSELSRSHEDNIEHLQSYLVNMMYYIRSDYYSTPEHGKIERLRLLVQSNLN